MVDDSGNSEIEQRLAKLESTSQEAKVSLLRQEHRLVPTILNFWHFVLPGRDGVGQRDLRNAALSALAYRIFSPGSVAVGAGSLLTIIGVWLAYMANQLLESQNELIKNQNFLVESSRRSTLVFEVSSILDEIDEELDGREAKGEVFKDWSDSRWVSGDEEKIQDTVNSSKCECIKLSNRLNGRIVAVSKALLPYKYQEDNGQLSKLTSPEQAQLFVSLVKSGICIPRGADFSNAKLRGVDVSYARLCKTDLRGANFAGAVLSDSRLISSTLDGANLTEAVLRNAFLNDSTLRFALLCGANLNRANLGRAHLLNTELEGAMLEDSNLSGVVALNSDFSKAKLANSKFSGAVLDSVNFSGADLSEVDFSNSKMHSPNLSGALNWTKISSMKGAIIYGTVNAPSGFETWATKNGARFVDTYGEWLDSFTSAEFRKAVEQQK